MRLAAFDGVATVGIRLIVCFVRLWRETHTHRVMQLVNRGHRSSSTVSADGHQLPSTTATDIALMRWSSRGFTAIPVEPDDAASTGGSSSSNSSSSTVGSLVATSHNGSASAGGPSAAGGGCGEARTIQYLTLDHAAAAGQCGSGMGDAANRWRRAAPQHKGPWRTKQQRHGKGTSSSASASIQPSVASSSSCLRDCLLCRCCRSGQYALSLGDDQTSHLIVLLIAIGQVREKSCCLLLPAVIVCLQRCLVVSLFRFADGGAANMDEPKEVSDPEEGNYECK